MNFKTIKFVQELLGKKSKNHIYKYGYESQDSFSLAFKKFHGHTPKEVRKGSAFQIFSPIRLSLSVEGGKNMDIKIMKKSWKM